MQVINKYFIRIVIVLLVLIEVSSLFLMYKTLSLKENKLDEVKFAQPNNEDNMFAVMVEGSDGTYGAYEEAGFPTTGYVYDEEMSGCIDINGNKLEGVLEYDETNNIASVNTSGTTYCYLYFSIPRWCKRGETAAECLLRNPTTSLNNSNIEGGMYRYQGTTADNYVCFGTSDQSACLSNKSKYMYRIIGIKENGQIKLIKNTSFLGSNIWNTDYKTDITWPNSDLFKSLNGLESDTITPIFIGNSTYDYMAENSLWYNKIATTEWKYGDTTSSYSYNGPNMYAIENPFGESTTSDAWTNTVSSKISLMYIHDYYYAYGEGGAPGSSANAKTAWMFLVGLYEWTMSRYGYYSIYGGYPAWGVVSDGSMNRFNLNHTLRVRPVFYLESTVEITGGTGTSGDPFILN